MKRILAVLLALMLLLTAVCAFAEEDDEEEEGGEGEIIFLDADGITPEEAEELTEESEPFVPDDIDRHIIGADDRITVKDTRTYPYSAIAYMNMKFPCACKNLEGTAFMVDRDKMLTAAHCLICQKHNVWATSITFYFGYRKGSGSMYKYTGGWTAHCGTSFPNGYTDENDWAFIKLEKNVGDKTGWFGRRYLNDQDLTKEYYYVAGYRNGVLKYDYGKVRVLDAGRMYVDMDVEPGNSGSPIYDKDDYAIGIWTTYWGNGENSGIRLTKTIKDYVNSH